MSEEPWSDMTFVPGESSLVMGNHLVLFAVAGLEDQFVRKTLEVTESTSDTSLSSFLDALTSGSVRELPPFVALLVHGNLLHCFVRGPVFLELRARDGLTERISGEGKQTWDESIRSDIIEASLAIDAKAADALNNASYSASFGVLPAAAARLVIRSTEGSDVLSADSDREESPGVIDLDVSVALESKVPDEASDIETETDPVAETEALTLETRDGFQPVGSESDPISPNELGASHEGGSVDEVGERQSDTGAILGGSDLEHGASRDPGGTISGSIAGTGTYDDLFGSTIIRSVEEAAVREESVEGSPVEKPSLSAVVGDIRGSDVDDPAHDGHTILVSELRNLRESDAKPAIGDEAVIDTLLAAMCPVGHPNPPHVTSCRVCGINVPEQAPVVIARPPLAKLTGRGIEPALVEHSVLIGRSPRLQGRLANVVTPTLVVVESPEKDVSRTHLELRVEGWNILATDLHSSNGTTVASPDRPLTRLRPGEPFMVEIGCSLRLADEVDLRLEAPT